MPEQEKKTRREKEPAGEPEAAPNPEASAKGKKIKDDLDKLMDEIDNVLEENAEEFVKNFVQRGGE